MGTFGLPAKFFRSVGFARFFAAVSFAALSKIKFSVCNQVLLLALTFLVCRSRALIGVTEHSSLPASSALALLYWKVALSK